MAEVHPGCLFAKTNEALLANKNLTSEHYKLAYAQLAEKQKEMRGYLDRIM